MLLAVVGLAALAAICLFISTGNGAAFGAPPAGTRLARMMASPNHRGGVFVNSQPTHVLGLAESGSLFSEFLFGGQQRTPLQPLPILTGTATAVSRPPASGLRITWLGHSSLLVEIDGTRVLTDPVFAERASPSTLIGPARFHAPPASVADLGELDAVVISHDHYDHLDMKTIQELALTRARFFVPLGVGAHLERWNISPARIEEHGWWQESRVGGVRLIATPARHFSGRALTDRDRTLWASWTLVGPAHRVYFSGDTGPMPEFVEIGKRFGPFDVALLEVGAYNEKWGDIHLGPRKALSAFRELRAKRLIPVHWGTFNLAFHAWMEPAETLHALARKEKITLLTPRIGESLEPTRGAATEPWWRKI
jgi:L-ascorbate metabolism protein UlaG (beta-lactamase superfamily)